MDRLPPELLGRIIEAAAPPPSLRTIRERQTVLRSCANVNRKWRTEAQRLLFLAPVISLPRSTTPTIRDVNPLRQLEASLKSGKWQVAELRVRWVLFVGDLLGPALGPLFELQAVAQLAFLSLSSVSFDPKLLIRLKNLKTLILHDVNFRDMSFSQSLPQLEHLTVAFCSDLPPCLLLPQLPSLTATAHSRSATCTEAALQHLQSHTCNSLKVLSIAYDDIADLSSKIARLSAFTLVDISFNDYIGNGNTPDSPILKHIRFDCNSKTVSWIRSQGEQWEKIWKATIPKCFPALETLVIPSEWLSVQPERYSVLEEFSREYRVKILIEEGWNSMQQLEGQMSRAFMKYKGVVY